MGQSKYNIFKDAKSLTAGIVNIITITTLLALTSFLAVGAGEEYFKQQLCLTETCLTTFKSNFAVTIYIINLGAIILTGWTALGGLVVSINNYFSNSKLASANIHLLNHDHFKSRVESLISRLHNIPRSNVDAEQWYGFAIPNSRSGCLEPSVEYVQLLKDIRSHASKVDSIIERLGSRYNPNHHMKAMRQHFAQIGIVLFEADTLDFHSIEKDALSLVNSINKTMFPEIAIELKQPEKITKLPNIKAKVVQF